MRHWNTPWVFVGAQRKGWNAALGCSVRWSTNTTTKLSNAFTCSSSIPHRFQELWRPAGGTEYLSWVLISFKNMLHFLLYYIVRLYFTFHLFPLCSSRDSCFLLAVGNAASRRMCVRIRIRHPFFFPISGNRGVYFCIFSTNSFPSSFLQINLLPSSPFGARGGGVCSFALLKEDDCIIFTMQTMDIGCCRQHGLCTPFWKSDTGWSFLVAAHWLYTSVLPSQFQMLSAWIDSET